MKYQMICPKCKYEFQYDNGYYDKNINKLRSEISEMNQQLMKYKTFSVEKKKLYSNWKKQILLRREQKINDLREFKQLRKLYDQQVNRYAFETFKSLTKDRLGEIEYKKLIEEMKKELEAYTTEQLMKTSYTKANYKSDTTSINKL